MEIKTSRFGVLEVDPGDIITFTQPIIGFQEFRRFLVLPGPADSAVSWLQSTESEDLAFLLMDPTHVIADYQVKLGSHELAELAVSGVEELEVYTILVVAQDPSKIRTNLKAPILINSRQRLGKQTVLEKSDYPIQFFLAQARQGSAAPEEVR
ncbi:MAG: flagellar assembly protein FliW [Candidatus Hydrogenedentes bacterium]|nr:flagellar assembly protein FliW [Candidatus Hydrogenedentota bacterium]